MDDELDFDRWESAIGKIVLSLSRVEGELLLKYEQSISRTKYFNATLSERLNKIEELYNDECGENDRASSFFEQIRKDIKFRNLVAHNPIFADMSGEYLVFKITAANNKSISLNLVGIEKESKRIWNTCIDFTDILRTWAKDKS
jgi:hypothetical protein